MRKAPLIAALLLCAFFVGAQAIDLSQVDLSLIKWDTAQFSLAGVDKLYVRGLGYQGQNQTFSMVLTMSMDANNQLHVAFAPPTAAGQLDTSEVAFATATMDGGALKIYPVMMDDGKPYAVWFQLESAAGAKVVDFKEVPDPAYPADLSVKNLLLARVAMNKTNATLQTQLDAATKAAASSKADVDAAKKSAAAAQAEADKAKKDAAVAQTTADQLKVELTLLKAQANGNVAVPAVDASKLDFSKVRASIAGPNAVYLRSIMYAGEPVSLLLDISADGSVVASGPYFTEQKFIQDSYEVSFLGITPTGAYTMELSPIVLDDGAYSATLEWKPGTRQFKLALGGKVAAPAVAGAADVAKAKAETEAVKKQLADLQAKLDAAAKAPAAAPAGVPAARYEKPSMTYISSAASDAPEFIQKTLKDGKAPDTAQPLYGTWSFNGKALVQSDATLKFAKFPVALPQEQTEILYAFTAKAKVGDWTGYGLHILASGVKSSVAYGFGNSYLVWLTRDVNYYQVPTTYVQFYRSYDDAKMVQLASVNIPESIGDELATEVIYNSDAKTVTIAVNGVNRLVYALDSAITVGDMAAFRTLGGPVEFSDLVIKVK